DAAARMLDHEYRHGHAHTARGAVEEERPRSGQPAAREREEPYRHAGRIAPARRPDKRAVRALGRCPPTEDAMDLEFVRYEKRDRVAYVTLNRPQVMNALHPPAGEELARVWDDVAADPDVWVAILTGAGERAFSAGNDLK